jgi:hypothetical protein
LPDESVGLAFHEVRDVERIRAERTATAAERTASPTGREPSARTYYLTEDQANELFELDPKGLRGNIYDPWCFYRRAGGVDGTMPWAEHPSGEIRVLTNEEGLADDEVDRETPRDLRVLVAGDSHTFGMCTAAETYPNRLEALFEERWPNRSIDVLNAGQGGYTFYQYLGSLEKYLDWKPDVFVVGVYPGNDFTELVGLAHLLDEGPRSGLTRDKAAQRFEITRSERNRHAVAQCFNAAFVFKSRPELASPTLDRAVSLLGRMQTVCAANDVHMVVAVIPAPCNMTWPDPVRVFGKVRQALELTDKDCTLVDRMTRRFANLVRGLDIPVVDMTARFRSLEHPPYWRKDQHLNVVGHDELARALFPVLSDWAVGAGRLPER